MPADAKGAWCFVPLRIDAAALKAILGVEVVERRRCVVHDAEQYAPYHLPLPPNVCWKAHFGRLPVQIAETPCRFETVYEVPAPSRPEPPEEATT